MSPLKIIPASAPIEVKQVVVLIWGQPGIGKSTLALSAEAPLLLDTDLGVHRAEGRAGATGVVRAASWAEIVGITQDDVAPYKTLVIDTVGRALDLLTLDICQNPKTAKLCKSGGALTQPGFGELKTRFLGYLNLIKSFGLDVVLVAHGAEQQQGDELIERIDAVGGSKAEIYRCSDAMGRLAMQGSRRVLSFSPADTKFGKDPANFGVVPLPPVEQMPGFLASTIQKLKARLNRQSAQQTEAAAQAQEFATALAAASTPADYTALIQQANGDKAQKRKLHDAATARGYAYDKTVSAYVDPSAVDISDAP